MRGDSLLLNTQTQTQKSENTKRSEGRHEMSKGWFWKMSQLQSSSSDRCSLLERGTRQKGREEVKKTKLKGQRQTEEPCSSREVLEKHVWKSSEWKKRREEEGGNTGYFRGSGVKKTKERELVQSRSSKRLTKLVWILTSLREQHKRCFFFSSLWKDRYKQQKDLCHVWGRHALILNNALSHTHLSLLSKVCFP